MNEVESGIVEAFRHVVREEATEAVAPLAAEQKRVRHLMAVLTTQTTAEQIRVRRRLAVLESTRLAPALVAMALSLAAFGVVASGGTAQAGPICPPGVGGGP